MALYMDDLLRNIRLQILEYKTKPYDVVKVSFLARELKISEKEVKQLLAELILDGKLMATIDSQAGLLEMNHPKPVEQRYKAMADWANSIANINLQFS